MSSPFILREFVLAVAEELNEPDPHVVAGKVLDRLTAEQRAHALEKTLPDYVRLVIGHRRHGVMDPVPGPQYSRAKAAREDWRTRVLSNSQFVGSGWKFLGDCTISDVRELARMRFALADETRRQGDIYEQLGAALAQHKREMVRDLPEPVLRAILAGTWTPS